MATVALAVIGSAVPGGAFVGAAIGGIIDQMFLFPALFPGPKTKIEGPRIQDLRLQSASYGAPLNLCLGPETRVSGTVIFMSNMKETAVKQKQGGGKGGGGGSVTSTDYRYALDCAIAVCEGPVNDIVKIWADGKVIYDPLGTIDLSDSDISVTRVEVFGRVGGFLTVIRVEMHLTAPPGGTPLSTVQTGLDTVVTGFTNAENNGTFKCVDAFLQSNNTEVCILRNEDCVDEAAGNTVTVFQDLPEMDTSIIGGLTIYKGTHTQNPDPMIESYKGAGEVPAFRGTAYVVFEDLQLRQFGNRLPTFNFKVRERETRTVKSSISQLLERGGWTTDDYRVADIDDALVVRGWAAAGASSVASQIQSLMMAFDITAFERNGRIRFIERGNQDTVAVSKDKLSARTFSQMPPTQLEISDTTGYDLPRKVSVRFFQPLLDYQQDTAEAQRNQKASPEAAWTTGIDADVEIVLPMVLSSAHAKQIATRVLWDSWRNRQAAHVVLPPSLFHLEAGDRLNIDSGKARIRVQEISRGALDHIHQVNGLLLTVDGIDFEADEAGDTPDPPQGTLYVPPAMTMLVLDIPALVDEHVLLPGYYVAACASSQSALFLGAGIFASPNNSAYALIASVATESVIVRAESVLPDSGVVGFTDLESTVDVRCLHGTIEVGTTAFIDVLNGANRLALGPEIIAWTTAEALGNHTYRLSGLIRGLRDTASGMPTHVLNEVGVVLDSTVQFIPENVSSIGQLRYWKAVAEGDIIADVLPDGPLTLEGNTLRPFAPAHFNAVRAIGNDITYSWIRVTRSLARLFVPGAEVPLIPNTERYEIDVYNSTDGSFTGAIVRTIAVESATSVVYTAAEQTSDGLTPGVAYDVKVYQLNNSSMRGNAAGGTL